AAVAAGATLIEKHLTLDRRLPGPQPAPPPEADAVGAVFPGGRAEQRAVGRCVYPRGAAERGRVGLGRQGAGGRGARRRPRRAAQPPLAAIAAGRTRPWRRRPWTAANW